MSQYSSFFVREDEKTVNSQTMHNSKVLAMDVGYGNSFLSPPPLPDWITKQPTLPTFFSFLSYPSMDINLLWSHLQYPSVSQWISFLINFLPNFLYESIGYVHNIAMRYAFCYYNIPKGFRWNEKGVEKISKTFSRVQPLTTLASSLHASVCGKEKTWWW